MKKVLLGLAGVLVLGVVFVLSGAANTAPPYVAGKRTTPPPTPGHAEARLATTDGTKLLLQSWLPAGEPRGVLVVVHGLKDYGDRYGELAQEVTRAGFAAYTVDLRGHGDSEGDRVWIERFDQYLNDLDVVFARVRAAHPTAPLFLFGHSMGGAIVTLYTEERKPPLAGLIVSAGALQTDAPAPLVAAARFFSGVAPRLGIMELDDTKFSRDAKIVESMHADPLIFDGKGPARTAAELLGAVERLRAHPERITVPVLALHGTSDAVTPPAGSKNLIEHVGTKDATLKSYDGTFHDLVHEPNGPQIRADLLAWLVAHVPASPAAPSAPTP